MFAPHSTHHRVATTSHCVCVCLTHSDVERLTHKLQNKGTRRSYPTSSTEQGGGQDQASEAEGQDATAPVAKKGMRPKCRTNKRKKVRACRRETQRVADSALEKVAGVTVPHEAAKNAQKQRPFPGCGEGNFASRWGGGGGGGGRGGGCSCHYKPVCHLQFILIC